MATLEPTREVAECYRVGDVISIRAYVPSGSRDVPYCTFEGGEVPGEVEGDAFVWTCPSCGTRNTTTIPSSEFEPDPDDLRDLITDTY